MALQTCAEAYVRLATGLGTKVRPERRLAAIEKAIRIYVKLLSRPSRKPIHVLMAAVARSAQAAVLEELGKVNEAELALRTAIELQVGIAEDFPNYPGYVAKVADYQYVLGSLLWSQGRHFEARKCFIVAQGTLVRVLEQWPDLATVRDTLAQYVRDCPDESIRNTDRTVPLDSPSGI